MSEKNLSKSFSIFAGEISEKTIQKWRVIQIASILPLLVCIALLFKFKGSMIGIIIFFLLLIVGILLPQIYRDLLQSHIILKGEIEELRKSLTQEKPSSSE